LQSGGGPFILDSEPAKVYRDSGRFGNALKSDRSKLSGSLLTDATVKRIARLEFQLVYPHGDAEA